MLRKWKVVINSFGYLTNGAASKMVGLVTPKSLMCVLSRQLSKGISQYYWILSHLIEKKFPKIRLSWEIELWGLQSFFF